MEERDFQVNTQNKNKGIFWLLQDFIGLCQTESMWSNWSGLHAKGQENWL